MRQDEQRSPATPATGWHRPLSRGFWVALGIGLAAVLVYVFGFSMHAQQWRNIRRAKEFATVIEPVVRAEQRYDGVVVSGGYTGRPGAGGSVLMRGSLLAAGDAQDLRTLVESLRPPVAIVWQLRTPDGEPVEMGPLLPVPR